MPDDVKEAPRITFGGGGDSAAVTVNEKDWPVGTISAVDGEGRLYYSIAGGADAGRFRIDSATGLLSFVSPPNFEAPAAQGGNNVYDVVVRVSDGLFEDTQTIAVTVANVFEGQILIGNSANNTLSGGTGEDLLRGNDGNDTLYGNGGADTLEGGNGIDSLYGGAGADTLSGGAGVDRFVFTNIADSLPSAPDRILDFSHAEGDRIQLSDIDANVRVAGDQAFAFIGSAAFTHVAGQLRVDYSGGDALVMGDGDGNGVADFAIRVDHSGGLVPSDFIL